MTVEIIGDKVYRASGTWSNQIHKFLNFLHINGFVKVPKALGFDNQNREILTFVPGENYDYPLPENAISSEALVSSAKLLRSYHDVAQKFLESSEYRHNTWMFQAIDPKQVICHNDFAPYNICFKERKAVGIIDFEAAIPGPRTWDIAYALYRFAPFTNPKNDDGFGEITEQTSRACLFLDCYGLANEERTNLVELIIKRLEALVGFLIESAEKGNPKYLQNLQDQHHLKYLEDIEYIKKHKKAIQACLLTKNYKHI